jgi:hypothetical protein
MKVLVLVTILSSSLWANQIVLTPEYKQNLLKSFGPMVDNSYYFSEDEMKEMTRREAPDDLKKYAKTKWEIFSEFEENELRTNFKKSFEDFKPLLISLFNKLYIEGYASMEEFNYHKQQLDTVKNYDVGRYCLDGDESNCRLWAFTSTKAYENLKIHVEQYLATIEATPKPKAGENQNATASQCKSGLIRRIIKVENKKTCKAAMKNCSAHSECCSSVCMFNDKGGGKCSDTFSCFKEIGVGEECSPAKPYCVEGVQCTRIDFSNEIGDCRENGYACESNSDCCSDKCVNKRCEVKFQCLNCTELGGVPKKGQKCCPGLYRSLDGRCIKAVPPFPGFTFKGVKKKSLFSKIINFIIPRAHAADCEGVGSDGLNAEQRATFDECINNYNKDSTSDAEAKRTMLQTCYDTKNAAIAENKACLEESGAKGSGLQLSRDEYQQYYNMPYIEKTFSEPRKCIFNSYNDSWRDRTNLERNAELVLRGFEAVYSGKGDDMIINESGQSIFKRASYFSKLMRENRTKLIQKYQEIDVKMTCLCGATFGLDQLAPEQKAFYKDKCPVISEFGVAAGNTNLGAVGITHEMLLMKWLEMRRNALIDLFKENQKIEDEFTELAEFIRNYNWYNHPEVKLNTVPLYRFNVRREIGWIQVVKFFTQISTFITAAIFEFFESLFNGDKEDYETTKQMWSFLQHKSATSPSNMDVVIANKDNKDDVHAKNDCWDQLCIYKYDIFERQYHHPTFDNKDVSNQVAAENHCQINGNPTQCIKSIYRDSYEFKNPDSEVVLEFKDAPLLDLTMPATVEEDSYMVEKTLANGATYTDMLNAQYSLGISALKMTAYQLFDEKKKMNNKWCSHKYSPNPIDKFSCEGKEHDTHDRCYNPAVRRPCKGERYVNKDEWDTGKTTAEFYSVFGGASGTSGDDQARVMEEALKAFMPKENNALWNPELFGDQRKAKFKSGIKLYAKCKNMVKEGCVKHSAGNFTDEHLGYGYLFEQDQDINDFADYVYEYHFLLPNFASDSLYSYPKAAQASYFDTIHYSVKILGSMALARLDQVMGTYALYSASYDKRKSEYESIFGVVDGSGSKNVEYSTDFVNTFKGLNFKNSVSMEQFNAKFDELTKGKDFSSSEMGALNALKKHVMGKIKQDEKLKHYDNTVGKTERGKKVKAASNGFVGSILNPLSKMSMHVGGKNFGKGAIGEAEKLDIFDSDSKLGGSSIKEFKQFKGKSGTLSSFTPATFESSSASNFSSPSVDGMSSKGNPDLSHHEVEQLLDSVSRNKEDYVTQKGDSLFTIITKTYSRNLSLILDKKAIPENNDERLLEVKKPNITKDKKEELKELLKN